MLITLDDQDAMRRRSTDGVRMELGKKIARKIGDAEELATAIPGLTFFRRTCRTAPASVIYSPGLAMIVHGSKRVVLGTATYIYDESRFLLTALDLPTIVEVTQASRNVPYLSFLLGLDLDVARRLIADIDLLDTTAATATAAAAGASPPAGAGMATGPATRDLLEAVSRLVDLLETPGDIPVLGDLIHREILYRLLTGPAGGLLRQTVMLGTHNRSARAIAWLRENFTRPLRIVELARAAGMGVSTLHHHFRTVTAMSPLQYQKHLRLHEARRLLLSDDVDAATAAFRVGYESATQFSREYRRLFGAPPMREIRALRHHGGGLATTVNTDNTTDNTTPPHRRH
ncbi:MAG: AraC family transcriptional regulator [Opitutaceae bacterium]|jgi:AraC-like DNA-binding protein|nr:AraC family transcriptional regulator [Opitutaceae bacterium]